jgi:protoporphyrinogen oxidase
MAAVLGFLRLNPYWKPLENYSAHSFLSATMGKRAYEMIWDPQLSNKFGIYKKDISLAWFWARVHKRTASLSYPSGGYLGFAQKLVEKIERFSGKVYFNTSVSEIIKLNLIRVTYREGQEKIVTSDFDSVIVTTPGFIFSKIAPQLPAQYVRTLVSLKGLGAVNLILRLKKPLMRDGTYWLSICEKNSPVMAVVEHTNFMSKKWYDNEHIVYIGNYVDHSHPYFSMNEHELLERFDKTLKTLRDDYQSDIIGMHSFKAYFAQPIIPKKYSHTVPSIQTPISNVYLANMQQIYPWDRGTNYAVELGNRVADLLLYEHSNRS